MTRPGDPWWRCRDPIRHIPATVASMLRAARASRGWTLDHAAHEIGCGWRMVSHLEAGDRAPSVALANDIITAYRLTPNETEQLLAIARPHSGRSSPFHTGIAVVAPR